ncbi:MAG: ATP-binding protein [Anaerolineae bacterium]|nr:ATP-binding protein [Anaerolineae bacterium]
MLNRLWVKLTLAFLAVALLAVGVAALLSLRFTGDEFRQYVVRNNVMAEPFLSESLSAYYAANGSWTGVETALAEFWKSSGAGQGAGMGAGMGMGQGRGLGMGRGPGAGLTLADASGRVLYDSSGQLTGRRLSDAVLAQGVALMQGDQRIGTLLNVQTAQVALDAEGQAFLDRVRQSLFLAGGLAIGLALVLGLLISWRLTAPLRQLTQAAGAIASGDLSQRVPARGGDELGEVGQAFNKMAASLEEGETLRRNMMADVAHELRTPLTVIQGNLQAILDGIYPLDEAQVASLFDETRLLTRLVDDLRELALAEAGQLRLEHETVDLASLARGVVGNFSPGAEAAGVKLACVISGEGLEVTGDADRLGQVLRNLISNALRHTPAGGRVTVSVGRSGARVRLEVADTGTGISPEDLPHVFDRFYRGDKSRSRRGGGAGLGLAIARQLVIAHGGEIAAESVLDAGTTFRVMLPAAPG